MSSSQCHRSVESLAKRLREYQEVRQISQQATRDSRLEVKGTQEECSTYKKLCVRGAEIAPSTSSRWASPRGDGEVEGWAEKVGDRAGAWGECLGHSAVPS